MCVIVKTKIMKIGDIVKMSDRNTNHLGNDVCAYAGMKGIVTYISDDGAFCLDCGTSTLVVPMNNAYKQKIKGIWIWVNDNLIFYKPIIQTPIFHKPIQKQKLCGKNFIKKVKRLLLK